MSIPMFRIPHHPEKEKSTNYTRIQDAQHDNCGDCEGVCDFLEDGFQCPVGGTSSVLAEFPVHYSSCECEQDHFADGDGDEDFWKFAGIAHFCDERRKNDLSAVRLAWQLTDRMCGKVEEECRYIRV